MKKNATPLILVFAHSFPGFSFYLIVLLLATILLILAFDLTVQTLPTYCILSIFNKLQQLFCIQTAFSQPTVSWVLMHTVCVCRHFVEACGHGLGINERLIKEDQQEYHDEMKANYRDLTRELSVIMHEHVSPAL